MKKACLYIIILFIALNSSGQIIKQAIPDKLVVLTFDDGVKSHITTVAPLLKQYNFGATFFVCEFPPNFTDTTMYMTWKDMKQLNLMGFEIANHTHTHKHVNKLSKQQLQNELNYIEQKCDSLQIAKPVTFAYPGYDVHPVATETLQEREYLFARTGGNRPYDPLVDHPYLIPGYTTTKTNKEEILEALTQAKDGKIVVLTIHGVPDFEHDWVTTPLDIFKEYLQYLKDNNFKVIALKDLSKYIDAKQALNLIKPDYTKE